MSNRRFAVRYKGEKYLGDSYEAIAFRIAKSHCIDYSEAFEIAKNGQPNKESPNTSNSFITGKSFQRSKAKGLSDYVKGATALVSVARGQTVPQEETNRRAIICSKCPRLEQIPGCMGCGLAGRIANAVKNIKKLFGKGFVIPNNLETKGCGVCGCALSVMLPAKIELFSDKDQAERPDNCWVKKTSPNYKL